MNTNFKKVDFNSSLENLYIVEKFVENICDTYNIFNSYYGNILVSVTEAVKNAIIHGNKNNKNKKVTLSFEANEKGLTFIVEDEGNGFNFKNLPNPLKDENPENCGKGLFLVKTLADEVTFNNEGRSVEISFKITSINYEIAIDRISKLLTYYKEKNTISIDINKPKN